MLETLSNKKLFVLIGCVLLSLALFPYLNYAGLFVFWVCAHWGYQEYKATREPWIEDRLKRHSFGESKDSLHGISGSLVRHIKYITIPIIVYIFMILVAYASSDEFVTLWHNSNHDFNDLIYKFWGRTIEKYYLHIFPHNVIRAYMFLHVFSLVVFELFLYFVFLLFSLPQKILSSYYFQTRSHEKKQCILDLAVVFPPIVLVVWCIALFSIIDLPTTGKIKGVVFDSVDNNFGLVIFILFSNFLWVLIDIFLPIILSRFYTIYRGPPNIK